MFFATLLVCETFCCILISVGDLFILSANVVIMGQIELLLLNSRFVVYSVNVLSFNTSILYLLED